MSRSGTSRRRGLDRRGATVLEMALVMNALLLLVLGSIEVGRYFFVSESMRYLVGEVARATLIDPDATWDDARKAGYIARTPILVSGNPTLQVVVDRRTAPASSTVRVTVQYPHQFALPYLSSLATSITTGVQLRFVATPLAS